MHHTFLCIVNIMSAEKITLHTHTKRGTLK